MAKPVQITILGDAKSIKKSLGQVESGLGSLGGKLKTVGKAGALALGGLAVAGAKVALDLDSAYKTIRAGTGATGEDLEALKDVFEDVAEDVPDAFGDVATVVADLNTRTGATGEELEKLAEQILDLSRLTGTDAATNVASLTRVFGDWGVASEDQAETLDKLFRASQGTGIGLDQLSTTVVNFGAPLRSLGFSMDESIALLSKFEQEGVNTEAILAGMKAGLGKMAKAGEEPAETLARLQEEIKGAGTEGEAMAIAVEAFGTRAGPDLAAAIREGRFEIDELADSIANGDETIASATDASATMGDKLKELKNRGLIKLVPILEKVIEGMESFFTRLEAGFAVIGRVIDVFQRGGLEGLSRFIDRKFGPNSIVARAVRGFVEFWRSAERVFSTKILPAFRATIEVLQALWAAFGDEIVEAIGIAFGFIKGTIESTLDIIQGIVDVFVGVFTGDWSRAWNGIKRIFSGVWKGMKNLLKTSLALIRNTISGALSAIKLLWNWSFLSDVFRSAKTKVENLVNALKTKIGEIPTKVGKVASSLFTKGKDIGKKLLDGVKNAITGAGSLAADIAKGLGNAVIDILNGLINKINDGIPNKIPIKFAPDIDLPDNPLPNIPRLRFGGPAGNNRFVEVGEQGREVLDLGASGSGARVINGREAGRLGAGGEVHVHFDGPPPASADQIGAAVLWQLRLSGRS